MIKKELIKKLVESSLRKDGAIDKKTAEFVIKNFRKRELKEFQRQLTIKIMEQTVTVSYEGVLSTSSKKEIESIFKGKRVNFIREEKMGGGLRIRANDIIINYNIADLIAGYVNSIN